MVEHIFEVERCEIGKHLLFGEVTPRFDADDGHETLLCTGIPGDETSFVVGKFNRVGADLIRNTGTLDEFGGGPRSEEHTSELQSLMRISYAVLCLKKKKKKTHLVIHTTKKTSKEYH